jgi:small subunit ribosomal protein S9
MSTDAPIPTPTAAETLPVEAAPPAATLPPPPANLNSRNPLWATGRRKAATARVRMFPGNGRIEVNGRPLDSYFPLLKDRQIATRAIDAAGATGKYDVLVGATGGGASGQAAAMALACARAIARLEPSKFPVLSDASMLTRDARVKERKKYGRRGARRGFQFSKR